MTSPDEFSAEDTHGFHRLSSFRVTASSSGLGWTSLYVSSQSESPFKMSFSGKPVILVSALNVGPVRASVHLADTLQTMRAGSGVISIVPDMHRLDVDLKTPVKTTHVFVRRELFDEVAAPLTKGDPASIAVLPRLGIFDPFLDRLCQEVKESLQSDPRFSALYVDQLARLLCAYLIRKHSTAAVSTVPEREGKLNSRSLARIRDFIENRLQDRFSLQDIADDAGIGPDHLGRVFKNTTGLTLYQFVIRCRVDLAQRLLSETSMPIATIALECGFSDQVSLTRSFRKVLGVTPAVFRAHGERVIITAQSRRLA